MKKMMLILVMLATVAAYSSPPPGPSVGIKIEFGRPKKNCTGFGICSIQFVFDLQAILESLLEHTEPDVGYGYPAVDENDRLVVKLVKNASLPATLSKYFTKGIFVVEEDYVIPPEVVDAIGLPPGYVIKKGSYKYSETQNNILLIL